MKNSYESKKLAIAWTNLRYEERGFFGRRKLILQRLNGSVELKSLNGLMGPSGSGKTTLLNCLSGNCSASRLSDDSVIYSINSASSSCFIEQNVHQCIVGRLTVLQILKYAFDFRNGLNYPNHVINEHITKKMDELMLPPEVLNRFFQNCSGGEQKRIAFAQELMSLRKPTLLFVDEPTTGLDSSAAFEVIKCLKNLSDNYRMAVIASIHQPNSVTLSLFDNLYVLAKGGVCIYQGPPSEIESELMRQNVVNTSGGQPLIETLMEMACNGTNDPTVHQLASSTLIYQFQNVSNRIHEFSSDATRLENKRKSFNIPDLYLQCSRLFRITFIANRRTFLFCILLYVVNFIMVASIFNSTGESDACYPLEKYSISCSKALDQEVDFKENVFSITYTLLYVGYIISYISTRVFSKNVRFFRNEHRNSWYSLGVFYWSLMIINFLEITFFGVLISFLAYFLSSQHAADDYAINWNCFGRYSLFLWLFCVYVQNFGQLFGVLLVDHPDLAIVLSMVYYNFVLLSNGMFVNIENNQNPLIVKGSEVVAMKFISKGILYAIYGVDRCDFEKEYSVVLNFFGATSGDLSYYIKWIVANIVAFRLFTFACLFLKFNSSFGFRKRNSTKESLFVSLDSNCPQEITDIEKIEYDSESNESSNIENVIIIGWRDLSLTEPDNFIFYKNKHPPKSILQNLNGQFCFGTLNALMGPSGAGKTSLLKVLNGQYTDRLSEKSSLYLSKLARIQTCFITQDVSEHLQSGLTVKQTLLYAARLKNFSKINHRKIVENLLVEFGLEDTVDTKVEKCSGGERKRIALALELTSLEMPNLICIDEPTSGLDSNSAHIVISYLRKVSQLHNITIITSIHQPNHSTLSMFDDLYVLAPGGICIYSGPPNHIDQHLRQIPLSSQIQLDCPIERLIMISCDHSQKNQIYVMQQITNENIKSKNSKLNYETTMMSAGILQNRKKFSLCSTWILFQRRLSHFISHEWQDFLFFSIYFFSFGLMLKLFYNFDEIVPVSGCLSYYGNFNATCSGDDHDVIFQLTESCKYLFFFGVIYNFFIYLQASLNFRNEFVYFCNEHRNGWYSTGVFYLTKTLTEILQIIPINLIYVFICAYYYEDVRPGILWNYFVILNLSTIAIQGLSHILAIVFSENLYTQFIVSTTIYLFNILLGNFYIPFYKLHYIYQFIANLSVVRYCYEGMIILLYGMGRCGEKEEQRVMYMMKLEDDHLYTYMSMLLFNPILYRCVALYLLVRKVNPNDGGRREKMWELEYVPYLIT